MTHRAIDAARWGVFLLAALWFLIVVPLSAAAAPYAAMVMDARSGKVLHSENANTRLHPASLTKMMTLYIAFEAVEHGEITLDTRVRVSKKAAAEPPSKLGLRAGQRIKLRYLIRAAAVKSANDASTAIAEAISGSEAAFARRMNRTAKAMGMTRTTFKNAHGLTQSGHLSTARDMTLLGRHMIYDYPEYYNLFSRRTADAGVRSVSHTNRRLLNSYRGADGIKTGYTRAAGFNLVASAERGRERVIATVFGGRSTTTRNARVAELLDLGFKRAPTRMALHRPSKPRYQGNRGISAGKTRVAEAPKSTSGSKPAAGKTIAVKLAVAKSPRPKARAGLVSGPTTTELDPKQLLAMKTEIQQALLEAKATEEPAAEPAPAADTLALAANATAPMTKPAMRPKELVLAAAPTIAPANPVIRERVQEVITRVSTSGGRHWGVNVGRYTSHYKAEKVLLKTALAEMSTLDGALRKVVKSPRGFDANFLGMTRESAELACQRLQARNVTCFMVGPS
ncbi:D-alanyl-D-alanine carboxypeptidase family protein [Primorskyibacter sp. S187A]|uniref:D-alanyl-D-alanine carboxypeptidase family protein n=1 Tax=Primorskyibacter sp. S187A TaxID=3415130 RepID=UPI003C7C78CF